MRRLLHLARRFFGSWRVHRPDPAAQQLVADLLSIEEAGVFWEQPAADLAHAVGAVGAVLHQRPERRDLARAALLHDVGKRHAALGTINRSIATALSLIRIPLRGRYRRYLAHAESGAQELEALGCEALVVQFARHHHGKPPQEIDANDWAALLAADDE